MILSILNKLKRLLIISWIFTLFPFWGFSQPQVLLINEILAINDSVLADEDGEYSDWLEIYNPSTIPVNLSGLTLSDSKANRGKWVFPDMEIPAGEFLVVFASGKDRTDPGGELHTNFSLSGSGEYLGLFHPYGEVIYEYSPAFPAQVEDISYGLYHGELVHFNVPTPGADNHASSDILIPVPSFSHQRGLYDASFDLMLSTPIAEGKIVYTTDGTEPDAYNGTAYSGPVPVTTTSVIRAVVLNKDDRPGFSATHTYLFLEDVIRQPNNPQGYPSEWGPYTAISGTAIADYEMDPEMMSDPVVAQSVKESLMALPVISLVTDKQHLFSHEIDSVTGGIYVYTGPPIDRVIDGLGHGWERPVSFEYFEPGGGASLQVNCGVRIQGGHSRRPEKSPKHSFRLVFRKEYGPGRLHYPFFGEEAASSFNTITLRAGFCNTWIHHSHDERLIFQGIRDIWAKDTQLDMGHPSCQSAYTHLYINGLYWGLYMPSERLDRVFAGSYLHGEEEDFDVIKDYQQVVDGEITAWNRLMQMAGSGLENNDKYQLIQGKTPDGNYDLSLEAMVDVENMMDYMLINFYGGNTDWDHHNWAAIRNRVDPGTGFKFFCWDSEHILKSVTGNELNKNNADCPSFVFQNLRVNEAFRRHFADRVQKHCFNGGALTPESAANRWLIRRDQIENALMAESARWGDYRRDCLLYTSPSPRDRTRSRMPSSA